MHRVFGYDKLLPMNTGVEGGETAVKLARFSHHDKAQATHVDLDWPQALGVSCERHPSQQSSDPLC